MNKTKIEKVEKLLSEAKKNLSEAVSDDVEELESSVCREKYLSEFESLCEKFDVELQEDSDRGKDEVYSEWNDAVNMSASDLQKWSRNPCSRQASKDPVAVIKRNLRLLDKNKEDWTSNDVEDAERTISFINRMSSEEMRPDSPREGPHGCPSEWAISLLNWAYNPFDSIPTPDEQVQEKLDPVEQVDLSEMMRDSGPQGYEFEPVPNQVLYSERSDAMDRAKDLGLDGVHEHEFGSDNVVMYMPGSEHRDWVERVKGLPDEENELEEGYSFEEDDQVTWESSGGQAYGVVRDRTNEQCYDASIDGDVKVCGEEDSPAYLIEVWNGEKDQLTGTMVAHKEDSLTKTTFKDDTAEMSEERDASQVFHSKQQERELEKEEDDSSVSVPPVAIHKVEGGETHEVSDDVEKVLDKLWNDE